MSRRFHKFWLKVTVVIIGSVGPVFFLGTMAPTLAPARLTLDLLGWRLFRPSIYDTPDTRFLSALTGGFLLGGGVTIWCLSTWVYDAAPEGVRRAVLIGVLSWFFLDSAGSIASGDPSNAAFNVLFLFAAVGPLWRPARGRANISVAPLEGFLGSALRSGEIERTRASTSQIGLLTARVERSLPLLI